MPCLALNTAMNKQIYLDYAATTPVDKRVLEAMVPYFDKNFGNPSSIHSFGAVAREAVEKGRGTIARLLGIEESGVIFTSGATESNNLMTKGVFRALRSLKKYQGRKLHFVTTKIEHHCVLDSFAALAEDYPNEFEATYLDVDNEGLVNPSALIKEIKNNTVLVSVMLVNNEVGSVQPLKEIAMALEPIKQGRNKDDLPLYFHSDATQAPSYFDCNVSELGLDAITLSAHKIYGPKGVGLLGIKKGVLLKGIQHGGGQERHMRSGTLNVPGIVGLSKALELAYAERKENRERVGKLRDQLIALIEKEISAVQLNGSKMHRSPNNVNMSFKGVEGEGLVLMLDQAGIAVSTGSACSAENLAPSHVQLAIGNDHLTAHSSIRMSLGKYTTKDDIEHAVAQLKIFVEKLRGISRGIDPSAATAAEKGSC